MLEAVFGDILQCHEADAIVNTTDPWYSGGGGLDYVIHKAAGRQLQEECLAKGNIVTGEAVITSACKLPFTAIIHAIGPVWKNGSFHEEEELRRCYKNIIRLADESCIKTLAIPAISTGVCMFPIELAAKIAVFETQDFLNNSATNLKSIIFVCDKEYIYEQYKLEIEKL